LYNAGILFKYKSNDIILSIYHGDKHFASIRSALLRYVSFAKQYSYFVRVLWSRE